MKSRRAIVLGAAVVVVASDALAVPPPFVRMVGDDTACPTPTQVVAVLRRLLPRTKVTAESGPATSTDATITDEGSQYRITIAGQERSFVDGARQCAERARHAAVFVALVLDPPMVPEPSEEVPTPPVATAPPVAPAVERPAVPSPARSTVPSVDLSLETTLLVAPAAGERETTVAGGFMAWGRAKRGLHLALGAGALRGSFQFADVAADAWWIPLHLAAGVSVARDRWEAGAEIGPNVTVLSVTGRDLAEAESQVRLEWGGRVGAFTRFWLSKNIALHLSAEGLARPSSYAVLITPEGQLGSTPVLWVGGAAGISLRLE
jgi:hypothetical protein